MSKLSLSDVLTGGLNGFTKPFTTIGGFFKRSYKHATKGSVLPALVEFSIGSALSIGTLVILPVLPVILFSSAIHGAAQTVLDENSKSPVNRRAPNVRNTKGFKKLESSQPAQDNSFKFNIFSRKVDIKSEHEENLVNHSKENKTGPDHKIWSQLRLYR